MTIEKRSGDGLERRKKQKRRKDASGFGETSV